MATLADLAVPSQDSGWFGKNAPGGSPTFNEKGAVDGGGTNFGNLSDPSAWMGLVGNDAQLRAWVTQQAPQLFQNNPQLLDYYVGKIKQQPGANPTEQAGSAQYWMQKIQADPSLGGGGAGGAASAFPNGATPEALMQQDPGFQFRLGEGMKAIERSAAAKGTLLTGGTLKDLTGYAQNYASGEFGNIFDRNLSLAKLGESAASGQATAGGDFASGASNTLTGIGNAQASGTIGAANQWNQGLGSVGNLALMYGVLKNPGSSFGTGTSSLNVPAGAG